MSEGDLAEAEEKVQVRAEAEFLRQGAAADLFDPTALPEGWDPDVFRALPADIQAEQMAQFEAAVEASAAVVQTQQGDIVLEVGAGGDALLDAVLAGDDVTISNGARVTTTPLSTPFSTPSAHDMQKSALHWPLRQSRSSAQVSVSAQR